jgi:uncharacterized protein (TIGR02246 family)
MISPIYNAASEGESPLSPTYLAIYDVFYSYVRALAAGDIETAVNCFAADAVIECSGIHIEGKGAIRTFAGRFAAQRALGANLSHIVPDFRANIDGDRARISSDLLRSVCKGDSGRVLPDCHYQCELVRQDGAWWLTRCSMAFDHVDILE